MGILIVICLYVLFIIGFIHSFIISQLMGVFVLIMYFFFSRTFLLRTFVPIALNWFGKLISNDESLLKIKNGEYGSYINYLGAIYVSYQDKDSSMYSMIKRLSYLAFLILPILFVFAFKLARQTKKL